jgi:hypothetical protein
VTLRRTGRYVVALTEQELAAAQEAVDHRLQCTLYHGDMTPKQRATLVRAKAKMADDKATEELK